MTTAIHGKREGIETTDLLKHRERRFTLFEFAEHQFGRHDIFHSHAWRTTKIETQFELVLQILICLKALIF